MPTKKDGPPQTRLAFSHCVVHRLAHPLRLCNGWRPVSTPALLPMRNL
jgi:hypothetical protein